MPVIDDVALAIEKTGDADISVNAATDRLVSFVHEQVKAGRKVALIGFSGGTLCINNAVRAMAEEPDSATLLANVHVLTIASAVLDESHALADGWPKTLASVFHVFDKRDHVCQTFGPVDEDNDEPDVHAFSHYEPHIIRQQLVRSGKLVLD